MPNHQPMPQASQPSSSSTPQYSQYGAFSSSPLIGKTHGQPSRILYTIGDDIDALEDFNYGVTVSVSTPKIRQTFVRKVYSILSAQLLGTCIVGWFASRVHSAAWVQAHEWAIFVPLLGSLVNLGLLYWKRNSHPINYSLFASFTLLESWSLGLIISYYNNIITLQALLIATGVFIGLALFTLQSKYDFSGMGPYLIGGLVTLAMTGIVNSIMPFGQTWSMVYASGGCLVFSGYIVFDTYRIIKKLSPDEFILGAILLYLDFVSLFIAVFISTTSRIGSENETLESQRL